MRDQNIKALLKHQLTAQTPRKTLSPEVRSRGSPRLGLHRHTPQPPAIKDFSTEECALESTGPFHWSITDMSVGEERRKDSNSQKYCKLVFWGMREFPSRDASI